MNEALFYRTFLAVWISLAAAIFIILLFRSAPYGRHSRAGWGPSIQPRLGWMIMEAPAAVGLIVWYCLGDLRTAASMIFFGLWELHYVYRAFIYPWRLRNTMRQMPLSVITMAFFFNAGNVYLNGRYLFKFSDGFPEGWLSDPRCLTGIFLFIAGFTVHQWSDHALLSLRWIGWALATWSTAGLSFAVWTMANLIPRARSHHLWYREKFKEYPEGRRILIPYVW
jgi:3-oxo-5-alpha-steroid 4-dehydrogenase 1